MSMYSWLHLQLITKTISFIRLLALNVNNNTEVVHSEWNKTRISANSYAVEGDVRNFGSQVICVGIVSFKMNTRHIACQRGMEQVDEKYPCHLGLQHVAMKKGNP